MKYLLLLLAATFCGRSIETKKLDGTTTSLVAKINMTCNITSSYVIDPTEDSEVDDDRFVSILKKEKSVLEVEEDLLRKYDIKMETVFNIKSWKGIHVRSMLPLVRQYIADRVEQFHSLDLNTTFNLLGKIGHVLRVAYAGCKEFQCSINVIEVMHKYQDLITNSTRLSSHMVNRCIQALKYHRYAYEDLVNPRVTNRVRALRAFTQTIPQATRIMKDSEIVVSRTEVLRNLSMNALYQSKKDLGGSKAEKERLDAKFKFYKEQRINFTENLNMLRNRSDDYKARVAELKEDEAKVDKKEEIERKKSLLTTKCELVVIPKFEEVCNVAKSFWGTYSEKCHLEKANMTKYECRKQLNQVLLDMRKEFIDRLAAQRKIIQDMRLKYVEKKLEVQLMQRTQFAELQKIGEKLTQFKTASEIEEHNLEIATTSLDLAVSALIVVQTQLKRMVDFWNNVVEHTKNIVENAEDDIPQLKERVLDSGLSWIALGKVLRIASHQMKRATAVVDDAFMRFPTSAEVENIIKSEGKQIIDDTIRLSKRYEKGINKSQETISEIRCQQQKQNITLKPELKKKIDYFNLDDDEDMDKIIEN